MAFYFRNHPTIQYDLLKDGTNRVIQNPLVRFKLVNVLKNRTALYYTYDLQEGQTLQFVADKYYGDVSLDWVIMITNDIIDPQYDLPLGYQDFVNYVRGKYGSIETAQQQTHHYEWIYQPFQKLFDGTIVPEKRLNVDATTYAGLPVDEKREVDSYTYEVEENEKKRTLKILQKNYLGQFLSEAESIFE
jgi:hypothetical protein